MKTTEVKKKVKTRRSDNFAFSGDEQVQLPQVPSMGFRCLGVWPRDSGGGVIVAGVDDAYGSFLIGALGTGSGGNFKDLVWVTLSPPETGSVLNLAEGETPLGLCGRKVMNGELIENIWVTYQDQDLETLAEAAKLILNELN